MTVLYGNKKKHVEFYLTDTPKYHNINISTVIYVYAIIESHGTYNDIVIINRTSL